MTMHAALYLFEKKKYVAARKKKFCLKIIFLVFTNDVIFAEYAQLAKLIRHMVNGDDFVTPTFFRFSFIVCILFLS